MAGTILSAGFSLADRTRPMIDGRVTVPGYGFDLRADHVHTILPLARKGELAVCEFSITDHAVAAARGAGAGAYYGLPVFMSRGYRHTALFVREGAGIDRPADLAGRRVGLPLYQQSASVWMRGLLRDLYGVDTRSITWRAGGVEVPEADARVPPGLPPALDVKAIGGDETLVGLIEAGELDALIAPRLAPRQGLRRLFANPREAEEDYFRATGFFPMMHLIALRRDVADADPALPAALTQAFMAAKALAVAELQSADFPRVTLPWATDYLSGIRALMGNNHWRYGFAESREELAALSRYVVEDGLADRVIDPAEMFHPATLAMRDAM